MSPADEPESPRFSILTIDGQSLGAAAIAIDAEGMLTLKEVTQAAAGDSAAAMLVRLDDLVSIAPMATAGSANVSPPDAPTAGIPVTVFPASGGSVQGYLIAPPEESGSGGACRVQLNSGQTLEFAFTALAAVQFGAGSEAARNDLQARLANRDSARDTLLVDSPDGIAAFNGAVDRLSAEGWVFRSANRELRGDGKRAFAVVLASGITPPRRIEAVLRRKDKSEWPGRVVRADSATVRFSLGGASPVDVPWTDIVRLEVRSNRVAFLSDLPWKKAASEGLLGGAWPVQRDRSTAGTPLSLAGRTFARGIGTHARSRLVLAIPAGFERFAATIGVDDAGAPHGVAVFRLMAGEKSLFESGIMRAGDKPREIEASLTGVAELILQTDFGEGLDLGAHADWANARLLAAAPPPAAKAPRK